MGERATAGWLSRIQFVAGIGRGTVLVAGRGTVERSITGSGEAAKFVGAVLFFRAGMVTVALPPSGGRTRPRAPSSLPGVSSRRPEFPDHLLLAGQVGDDTLVDGLSFLIPVVAVGIVEPRLLVPVGQEVPLADSRGHV